MRIQAELPEYPRKKPVSDPLTRGTVQLVPGSVMGLMGKLLFQTAKNNFANHL